MSLNLTIVLQILSFLILLGLLAKFLYKPFMKYLDERANSVKRDIEDAESNRKKAEEYLDTSKEELRRTKEEVLDMRESTAREADKDKMQTLDEAKKEALAILAKAELGIKKEIEKTKEDAKKDIASLSVEIAKKILGREVKEKDHKKLIKESIEDIIRESS